MRLPTALVPLRHPLFRLLWSANVVVSLGVWLQNTGAGWLMTTLAPNAFWVSMVQAATILPIFLFALPAGAVADILDRRSFIFLTQSWMLLAASLLAVLTYTGLTGPVLLLALTFAIGIGTASNSPAWGSVLIEVVPRQDLVQAVALNSVGFNLARAVGPALAGLFLLFGGPALTFGLNATSYLAVIGALLLWHRRRSGPPLPREHLPAAIRAGMRFARHTPLMRSAMLHAAAYFAPAAAPWAMLPLVVRQQLHLGAGTFGLLLGLMGSGGVAAGMVLPHLRTHLGRGNTVLAATLCSAAGMATLAFSRHWPEAAVAMLIFGLGWVGASSVTQGTAQLAAPPWVRSRALAIYQLSSNGGLVFGTFVWGWLGTRIGLPSTLLTASVCGVVLAFLTHRFPLDQPEPAAVPPAALPSPEAVAPELGPLLGATHSRVLQIQAYRIDPARQADFLALMVEVREARGRAGAVVWHLYEDVAHAESWVELWLMEDWADHQREAARLSPADRATLARALAFSVGAPAAVSRFLAVAPHRMSAPPPTPQG